MQQNLFVQTRAEMKMEIGSIEREQKKPPPDRKRTGAFIRNVSTC